MSGPRISGVLITRQQECSASDRLNYLINFIPFFSGSVSVSYFSMRFSPASFLRKTLFRKAPRQHQTQPIRKMSSSTSAILYAATLASPTNPSARPDDPLTKEKAHHRQNGRFQNPWDSWKEMAPFSIISAMARRRISGSGNSPNTTPPTVPVRKPDFLPSRETGKLRATWLGHACYYVEFPSGLRVLFDPVFTDRCSPLSWLG